MTFENLRFPGAQSFPLLETAAKVLGDDDEVATSVELFTGNNLY